MDYSQPELKEIFTNTVSRGGYEPTTVPLEERSRYHILMTISQISTFNPTSFLVLTIVGYLIGRQYNSRACFTSENAMSPMGFDPGTSRIVRHRPTN